MSIATPYQDHDLWLTLWPTGYTAAMLHAYFSVYFATLKINFFQVCYAASLLQEKQALAAQESVSSHLWPLSAELVHFTLKISSVRSLCHQVGQAGKIAYGTDTVGYITPTVFATGKPLFHIDWISIAHTWPISSLRDNGSYSTRSRQGCQAHIACRGEGGKWVVLQDPWLYAGP